MVPTHDPAETAPVEPPSESSSVVPCKWVTGSMATVWCASPHLGSIDVSEIVTIPDRPPESTIPPFPSPLVGYQIAEPVHKRFRLRYSFGPASPSPGTLTQTQRPACGLQAHTQLPSSPSVGGSTGGGSVGGITIG